MILFDTSVFIAGMMEDHEHHQPSVAAMQKVFRKNLEGAVCVHSLAECYATLTVYPDSPLSPEETTHLIETNILSHFHIVELTRQDYQEALKSLVKRNLRSGSIFDALIYQAAVKKKAKVLYTWNEKHFSRLTDGEIEIRQP